MSESTRAWIYRVSLAALGAAVAYGLIADQDQIAAVTALVTALVGNGLAAVNTTTTRD